MNMSIRAIRIPLKTAGEPVAVSAERYFSRSVRLATDHPPSRICSHLGE